MIPDKLDSAAALRRHLRRLFARDPRLKPIAERAGAFDIRLTPGGFAGLVRVTLGQQLSVASARAIWTRYAALPGALEPAGYLTLSETELRDVGFSRSKVMTVEAIARAMLGGELDLAAIEAMPATEAVAALCRIKGIGPWTAEIYLMFCAGHPDIFPAGDLALQKAVGHALDLGERVAVPRLAALAEAWAPHRHAAALLFWRYYAAMKNREGIAL
jgi:DNA-3-methyladenine glycosylase II